ncbi:ABC transporter substrate-binding protein [Effusibacillus dendaii]|uniref:Branched-chain amino acid ABC transporter substrate-binding protein n=1 Tax=Effusibacillus dendaii TaxID=2743772 RepID=A0A7I8D8Y5_9BACL|nr:ABC transporter substrate-binding protein [Effusibacillus dendaii]BCJ85459.1 branched-chain amino acid ABC transporter substrate-binding protein [Effusibacillus dendaii]
MNRKWKSLLALTTVSSMLFLTACGSGGDKQAAGGSGSTKEVTIGYTGPLSGGAALYGKNALDGIEMAAEEINNAGGIKVGKDTVKLKVVSLDDKYLPNESVTNARRLKQENKASIIFCPHSGGILALQQINQQENFLIGAYTSEPRVIQTNNALSVRIPPGYDNYPKPWSEEMMKRFGKKLALVPTTSQYGKDWSALMTKTWKDLGGEVVADSAVDYNKQSDFSAAITKALAANPDVLFVGGPSQPTALVIKAARDQGFKGGFIVMDQAKVEEIEPVVKDVKLLEGYIGVYPASKVDSAGVKAVVAAYQKKFGADKLPTSETLYNYGALIIFAKAMELAGKTDDAKAIRAKLDDAAKQVSKDKLPFDLLGVSQSGAFNIVPSAVTVKDGKEVEVKLPEPKY